MTFAGSGVGELPVTWLRARTYRVPTATFGRAEPETDGTARWEATGVLVVQAGAADQTGLGFAYTDPCTLDLVRGNLADQVLGHPALDTARAFWSMAGALRNTGWPGVAASAISAVDIALHDLSARLLGVPLTQLLGGARSGVRGYGSGGFTSYSCAQLQRQLADWAGEGMTAVKMKVGSDPAADVARVRAARQAIGDRVELFVDANGAYSRKQALGLAEQFTEFGVTWLEEPVSSDDLAGLRLIRDRGPAGMQIAAGEYGYTPPYFAAMLAAGAVDTLQADATRCGGVTGFLNAAAQAQAAGVPLSAHTAPALHAQLGAALPNVVHVEDFHDHRRIEALLFDGVPVRRDGRIWPDRSRPGLGLDFKAADAAPYLLAEWSSS